MSKFQIGQRVKITMGGPRKGQIGVVEDTAVHSHSYNVLVDGGVITAHESWLEAEPEDAPTLASVASGPGMTDAEIGAAQRATARANAAWEGRVQELEAELAQAKEQLAAIERACQGEPATPGAIANLLAECQELEATKLELVDLRTSLEAVTQDRDKWMRTVQDTNDALRGFKADDKPLVPEAGRLVAELAAATRRANDAEATLILHRTLTDKRLTQLEGAVAAARDEAQSLSDRERELHEAVLKAGTLLGKGDLPLADLLHWIDEESERADRPLDFGPGVAPEWISTLGALAAWPGMPSLGSPEQDARTFDDLCKRLRRDVEARLERLDDLAYMRQEIEERAELERRLVAAQEQADSLSTSLAAYERAGEVLSDEDIARLYAERRGGAVDPLVADLCRAVASLATARRDKAWQAATEADSPEQAAAKLRDLHEAVDALMAQRDAAEQRAEAMLTSAANLRDHLDAVARALDVSTEGDGATQRGAMIEAVDGLRAKLTAAEQRAAELSAALDQARADNASLDRSCADYEPAAIEAGKRAAAAERRAAPVGPVGDGVASADDLRAAVSALVASLPIGVRCDVADVLAGKADLPRTIANAVLALHTSARSIRSTLELSGLTGGELNAVDSLGRTHELLSAVAARMTLDAVGRATPAPAGDDEAHRRLRETAQRWFPTVTGAKATPAPAARELTEARAELASAQQRAARAEQLRVEMRDAQMVAIAELQGKLTAAETSRDGWHQQACKDAAALAGSQRKVEELTTGYQALEASHVTLNTERWQAEHAREQLQGILDALISDRADSDCTPEQVEWRRKVTAAVERNVGSQAPAPLLTAEVQEPKLLDRESLARVIYSAHAGKDAVPWEQRTGNGREDWLRIADAVADELRRQGPVTPLPSALVRLLLEHAAAVERHANGAPPSVRSSSARRSWRAGCGTT